MEISLLLLEEIIKLFLVMVMGYALIKTGKLKAADGKALSVLLVYLILPCVIIHSFQLNAEDQVKQGLLFALIASVAVHIIFIAITTIIRKPLKLIPIEQVSLIYTNAGILVFPLVTALLGPQYVVYPCTYMAVQLTLLWSHGNHLLCGSNGLDLKVIFSNINIVSIIAGAILFIFQIHLPVLIDQTMATVGNIIGPIGMLITGMAIAEEDLKTIFLRVRSYLTIILRLIALPLVIVAICAAVGASGFITDGKNILMTIFIACITPTAAIVTSMAELYDQDPAYSAELCVLSTILSIITMPLILFVFNTVV